MSTIDLELPTPGTTAEITLNLPEAEPDPGPAFVTSLAVGLVAAQWETEGAVAELVAASGGDAAILDAACTRALQGAISDPTLARRAAQLLGLALARAATPQGSPT